MLQPRREFNSIGDHHSPGAGKLRSALLGFLLGTRKALEEKGRRSVTLAIGGVTVVPDFAGLAGCCVGLNQINVRVPANVLPGNAVPVVLSIGGVSSNTASLAVQ